MRGTKLFAFRATALDSHSSLAALPLDAGEHVITLVVEKKDKLNGKTSMVRLTGRGVVNFHCMQRCLEISMFMRSSY